MDFKTAKVRDGLTKGWSWLRRGSILWLILLAILFGIGALAWFSLIGSMVGDGSTVITAISSLLSSLAACVTAGTAWKASRSKAQEPPQSSEPERPTSSPARRLYGRRRNAEVYEAMRRAQQAIEDTGMARSLHGVEVEQAMRRARQDTDRWTFRGGTGRYLRAVTLPECVREAQRQRRSLVVKIDIVNPTDERACSAHARFRQTFAHRLESVWPDGWSAERTIKESYATVLAACWYRQRLDTLEIDVHLSSVVPALRFDLSSSCLIITQDDPQRANLYIERGRPLYDYYVTELYMYREQAVKLSLRDAALIGDEPTVDEVRHLFNLLDVPLPSTFIDRDVIDIVDKALRPENPYGR